ncbi:pilus assembly FimT family protein [Vibrio sp. RC27]
MSHYLITSHKKGHKKNGFTLIEVLTVMAVIMTSLYAAIPQMAPSLEVEKVASTARDVMQFIDDAKSLARMRNQALWIEVYEGSADSSSRWYLRLRTSTDTTTMGNVLQQLVGEHSLKLDSGYLNDKILIDGLKGKVSNGSLKFSSASSNSPVLKVITSYGAGRIRLCSLEEKLDGIPLC